MATHYSKYTFGDIVYLITDQQQSKCIVYAVEFHQGGVMYHIASGNVQYSAYELELSDTPDNKMKLGIED